MKTEQKLEIAKLAAITTTVEYLQKIALATGGQEEALSDGAIAEVVARADKKIPDSVVATADSPQLVSKIISSIKEATEEMEQEGVKLPPKVSPEDLGIVPVGAGSVMRTVMTDANANSGGVEITPEVKISDFNLATDENNELSTIEAKLANLDWQSLTNIVKQAQTQEEVINTIKGGTRMSNKNLEQVAMKLASLAGELLKVATGDAISAELAAETSEAEQKNNGSAISNATNIEAEVPAAKINELAQDSDRFKDTTEAKTIADAGIKSNPTRDKKANSSPLSLKELIAKHASR